MPALFEAYVTNLGKYNEGELVGEYLKFPTTPEEVQALLKRIGVDGVRYEEIFITDFNGDVLGLYNGNLVRWFEDYYPISNNETAGIDFLNENGTVDVYAVRDLENFSKAADGSVDPAGKLIGLKEFTKQEFDARDIEALKNSTSVAMAGAPLEDSEIAKLVAEYEAFGVPRKEGAMADAACKEEYTYQIGKITFIVTPVYKDEGEPMRDILLKLMLADLEPV